MRLGHARSTWYKDPGVRTLPGGEPMFPTLFSPLSIKTLTLRKRITSTPHSDGMAEGGLVTERLIAYFRAKAAGGAGLIMGPAGGAVHPTSPTRAGGLELHRPEVVDGLRRLAGAV